MSPTEHDEFDTDKGVKDNYDGLVTDAFFQVNDSGDTNLVLKKLADDGEEVSDYYRAGPDWASFDGGETIEHPSKSKVRADSQLALLTEKAMKCSAEAEQVIRERSKANGSRGQKTAKLWPGLRFHWDVEAKEYDFKNRETGEEAKGISYKSYPSAFLGVETIPDASSTESTGSSTATPSASTEVPPEVEAKLKVLAQSKSFSEWVDEALTIDYVRENMLSTLSDEAYYNSLKG